MFMLCGSALDMAAFLSEHLVVHEDRMRENVRASNGLTLAVSFTLALTPILGQAEAKQIVKDACEIAAVEKRHLADVLRDKTNAPLDWDALKDESQYLGSSHVFIDRVIRQAEIDGIDD
jgi:3-carboxy-cis,cis-muconate cycloisomerase